LKERNYNAAKNSFNKALNMCREDGISWLKQIILNNLGNSHRKNKEYSQAIECY